MLSVCYCILKTALSDRWFFAEESGLLIQEHIHVSWALDKFQWAVGSLKLLTGVPPAGDHLAHCLLLLGGPLGTQQQLLS